MKISLSWLADYIDVAPMKANLADVLEKLTMRGLEVEKIEDLSAGFEKVIVAQIESRDQHPNADRLSVCSVNISADPSKKELLQIVCGAKNMKAGDKVALSMIGAHLPNGVKIEKGKIRDVESFGMLCSEAELGLAAEADGILILPASAAVGSPVAALLGRNDVVFEINVTPNRGDALSFIGIAREIASILSQELKLPKLELKTASQKTAEKISVSINAGNACLQYHAKYIEGVTVKESPEWLKKRLLSVGMRPINNIVDVTNFILMELGTPLHAFDYNKLNGAQVQVRNGKAGEKLPLLDGTEVLLTDADIVIADAEKAVALAGVMGGGNSEVTTTTRNILLEAAQFEPGGVRASSKRHQKKTDSSFRFERQIDSQAVLFASDRAAALIAEVSGGKVHAGTVSSYSAQGKVEFDSKGVRELTLSVPHLNSFLGTDELTAKSLTETLKNGGFSSKIKDEKNLIVTVPSYRPDVTIEQDLSEEVLRVWGFDRILPIVPQLNHIPGPEARAETKARQIEKIKLALMSQGLLEVMNYAFTSKSLNDAWGKDGGGLNMGAKEVGLANPLNEEFTTLKTSLLSGLFQNFLTALNHHQNEAKFFEVRPVYFQDADSDTGVKEQLRIAGLLTGMAKVSALDAMDKDMDFFDAKGVLENFFETIGCKGVRFEGVEASAFADGRFHPGQTARVLVGRGPCGILGKLHPQLQNKHKIKGSVFLFEMQADAVMANMKSEKKFAAISKFPKVPRDLSLIVPDTVKSDRVLSTIQKHGKPLLESLKVVDLYRGEKIAPGTVSLSVSLVLSDAQKTLTDADVEKTIDQVLKGLDKDLSVKLRTF